MSSRFPSRFSLVAWLIVPVVLLSAIACGQWRSTATGPQVQVPMFYDAHYLFPRPWRQADAAPGVPDPAPLALYGPNRVRQTFRVGSDGLSRIGLPLSGPTGSVAEVRLENGNRLIGGEVVLQPGQEQVALAVPAGFARKGERVTLHLRAPDASADFPVLAATVGGDRLGDSLRLNEYWLPGNLVLATWSMGDGTGIGRWWLDALAEQTLPALFRLRLQQYKPPALKGNLFPVLLVTSLALTGVAFLLALPRSWYNRRTLAALATGLIAAFLLWQSGTGRLVWSRQADLRLQPMAAAAAPPNGPISHPWPILLWTLERLPEPRFVETRIVAGQPAIAVPTRSGLGLPLVVPDQATLTVSTAHLPGMPAARMRVTFGSHTLFETESADGQAGGPHQIDLSPFARQTDVLRLITEPLESTTPDPWPPPPALLWLHPVVESTTPWLHEALPESADLPPGGPWQFGRHVTLVGVGNSAENDLTTVTLCWQATAPTRQNPVIFLHLLDADGQIIAQSDAPPLAGSYPVSVWEPGQIVCENRTVAVKTATVHTVAIGLYDPVTFVRWPVTGPDGTPLTDDRILLPAALPAP
jgi:hypothetical protein